MNEWTNKNLFKKMLFKSETWFTFSKWITKWNSVSSSKHHWGSLCKLRHFICLFILFIFVKVLFNFRERGREGEKEGEKHQYVVVFPSAPYWGPGPQPRHVPRLGIEPSNHLVRRPVLSPLSHTSQGKLRHFKYTRGPCNVNILLSIQVTLEQGGG